MRAAAFESREDDVHRFGPGLLFRVGEHLAHVVGVAKRDVAFAGRDGLDLVAVAAVGLLREVGLQAFGPGRRIGLVMVDDDRAEKRDVVVMQSRAGAEAALPLVRGEILIGGDLSGFHAVFRGIDDAGAGGEAEPVVVRVTQFGGDVGFQHIGLDGLRDTGIDDLHQAGNVDGENKVRGRAVALGLEPFGHALVDEGHIDLDPGFGSEGIDEGLDQLGLAVGVDVDLLREGRNGGREEGKGRETQH